MVVCRTTLVVMKIKRTKTEQRIKWWKLKREECCVVFREGLRQALGLGLATHGSAATCGSFTPLQRLPVTLEYK